MSQTGQLERFAEGLLHRVGIRPNPENVRAIVGWARAEGGHFHNTARFNPLNTTMPAPGAGNTGTQGNIKVYRDWRQGVKATARTLENGLYGGVLHALAHGSAEDVARAIGSSPWGTSEGLVGRVIAETPRIKPTGRTIGGGRVRTGPHRQQPGVAPGRPVQVPGLPAPISGLTGSVLDRYGLGRTPPPVSAPQAPLRPALPLPSLPGGLPSVPESSGGPAPKASVADLVGQLGRGGQLSPVTVRAPGRQGSGKGQSRKGGGGVSGKGGLQLPRRFGVTHQTAGLPGYPARDIFGKPGEPVRAPVSGKVVRLSGSPPSRGAYEGQGGPFGWSIYIRGDNGATYFLTHFGSRDVRAGQRVRRGQVIGTVGDYPGSTPDHIHEGRHG